MRGVNINGVTVEALRKTVARLILIFMTLIGGSLICETPVFGITNATISISLGTLTALDLTPGHFGSTSQSVGVTTDNYTGYTVSLTNSVNDTALVNTSDNTLTIPTITLPNGSTSITASQFDSGYGISADGTNYVPAPTSASNIILGTTNASGTSSHTVTFGAKPATDTATGTYNRTFIITAVVNNPQYSITYDENTTDTVNNMPSNVSTTISSTGTVDLSVAEPTRTGYVFLGWDEDDTVTSNPTYQPGDTITLEPTQANAIELYAIWEERSSGSGTAEDPYIDSGEYDPTDLAEGTTLYEEVAGAPEVTVDENGDIRAFEFTDLGTGTDVTGFDTGVVAFDGSSSFTVHIKFTETLSNDTSYDKIFAVIQDDGTSSSHSYSGFTLFYYYRSTGGSGGSGSSSTARYLRTQSFSQKTSLQGQTMSSGGTLYKTDTTVTSYYAANTVYEFDVSYDNSTSLVTVTSTINNDSSTTTTTTFTSNVTTLTNATVVIGGNGLDNTEDMSSTFLVSEFSVEKQGS